MVLSPIVKCISDGYILLGESLNLGADDSGMFLESLLLIGSGCTGLPIVSSVLVGGDGGSLRPSVLYT